VKWTVEWTASAERDFGKLDPETRRTIKVAIDRYAADSVGDVLLLQDIAPPEYRLRVGKWRARFRLDHDRRSLQLLHVLRCDELTDNAKYAAPRTPAVLPYDSSSNLAASDALLPFLMFVCSSNLASTIGIRMLTSFNVPVCFASAASAVFAPARLAPGRSSPCNAA